MLSKRNKDSTEKENVIQFEEDQYEHTETDIDFESNESVKDTGNGKVTKKRKVDKKGRIVRHTIGAPRKTIIDEKFELVKKQCGSHGVGSMAIMLDMNASTLCCRIKSDGLVFTPKPEVIICSKIYIIPNVNF